MIVETQVPRRFRYSDFEDKNIHNLLNKKYFLGCKGFYRRTIMMKAEYICRTGRGDCDLTEADHPRKRCQKCRLEKCEAVSY